MSEPTAADRPTTVAGLAELYLGNILYALERTAVSLETEAGPDAGEQAAFYRGIGRLLAEAHGKGKGD